MFWWCLGDLARRCERHRIGGFGAKKTMLKNVITAPAVELTAPAANCQMETLATT